MNETDPITKLKEMPLELREAIYYESTEPLEVLEPPAKLCATLLDYLRSQLPESFQNDTQIASEAAMALLRRALQTVTTIKVPDPEFLQPVQSLDMKWSSARRLEFTETQKAYAFSSETSSAARPTVHDIVSRCPNLEVLTFCVSEATLLEPHNQRAADAGLHEVVPFGNILRVNEHPSIRRLDLGCEKEHWTFNSSLNSILSTKELEPFVQAFQGESKACGRTIELEVDLSPGFLGGGYEKIRCRDGVFTWGEWHDWFG